MKLFSLLVLIAATLCLPTWADETDHHSSGLPEGHWLSQKFDKDSKKIITYENWFEETVAEGRVFRFKIIKEESYTPSSEPTPIAHPHPEPSLQQPWYCFAHDYIAGHLPSDPKDDSCINVYYKAKRLNRNQAEQAALAECQRLSKNHTTCELNPKKDCFPEKYRAGASL